MKLSAFITLEVRDSITGKLLRKRRFESDSYVLAFIDLHYRHRTSAATTVRDYTGVNRNNTPNTQDWRMDTNPSFKASGIVVGTGVAAVEIWHWQLQTLIADGSGAGELVHQLNQFVAPVTIGDRRRFFMTRTFLNQSGGAIIINETGVYTWGQISGQGFCIIRDTVVPGETVPDLSSITVQYEIFAEA